MKVKYTSCIDRYLNNFVGLLKSKCYVSIRVTYTYFYLFSNISLKIKDTKQKERLMQEDMLLKIWANFIYNYGIKFYIRQSGNQLLG